MLEAFVHESDIRIGFRMEIGLRSLRDASTILEAKLGKIVVVIGFSANFGVRSGIWLPSTNFRVGIWQIRHRIWTQRAKMVKMDYLFAFFGARMRKHDF